MSRVRDRVNFLPLTFVGQPPHISGMQNATATDQALTPDTAFDAAYAEAKARGCTDARAWLIADDARSYVAYRGKPYVIPWFD